MSGYTKDSFGYKLVTFNRWGKCQLLTNRQKFNIIEPVNNDQKILKNPNLFYAVSFDFFDFLQRTS